MEERGAIRVEPVLWFLLAASFATNAACSGDARPSGAGARDDPQARRGTEQGGIDAGRAADQETVGVRQLGRENRRRPSWSRVDRPTDFSAQQLQSGCGEIVRDDNLQCDFARPMLRT